MPLDSRNASQPRQHPRVLLSDTTKAPPEKNKLHILIIQDVPSGRHTTAELFEANREMCVIDEVASYHDAVAAVCARRIDVVLVCLGESRHGALAMIRDIRIIRPGMRILALSAVSEPSTVLHALELGADGFLIGDAAITELPVAMDYVSGGRHYISPGFGHRVAQRILFAYRPGSLSRNTARALNAAACRATVPPLARAAPTFEFPPANRLRH